DRIDLVVDLAGHTGHNRLGTLAKRPAPVQVTYLGYPNTTGLTTIDYVLVDSVTAPEDESKRFVETPFRLDGGFSCFAPRDDVPPVGPLPALRNGYVTFGATHGLIKLNAVVLDLWSELLRAVRNSRLRIARDMLSGEARERLRVQFLDRGIDAERVEFHTPPVGASGYWDLYHDFDIALDTFPWSGHTTACEALWMGVPVITLRGKIHAARMVASALTHARLTDWIASSKARYVALAAKRAADVNELTKLRAGLREHVRNSPLCDAAGFTRKLEEAYRTMWRKWCK
ncbi:MAG: O-linked N-acetylglucosamine transferase, SPINDLY family protein, partial [Gemmataceae bacterium]